MDKLIREIDGHKFCSKAYDTEREAKDNALKGFYALYEDGSWFNYNSVLGFQEDVIVKLEQLEQENNTGQGRIDKITKLSAIMFDKKRCFDALGMMNRATDPKKRREQYIEYELARSEFIEASANLNNAQYKP